MIYRFGCVSKEKIQEFEEKYGLTLPEDYKNFLEFTNGGMANRKPDDDDVYIPLEGLEHTITPNYFFGLETGDRGINLDHQLNEYGDEIPENTVLFGDALEYGYMVMICGDSEDAGIYYWDDHRTFPESTDEGNTYFVAESFSEFMELCGMPLEPFTETHTPSWIRELEY